MKIIHSVDSLALYSHPQPNAQEKSRLYAGNGYFENERFYYQAYTNEFKYGQFYLIDKQVYRQTVKVKEGTKSLLTNEGQQPDLPSFFLDVFNEQSVFPQNIIDNKFTISLNDYPEEFDKSLVLFDLNSKQHSSIPSYSLFNPILNNAIYGIERRARILIKRDFNLNTVWQYNIDSPANFLSLRYAFIDHGIFITFIGPAETLTQVVNGVGERGFSGGELMGFNDADGSVAWRLEIPNAVDNIKQHGKQLVVASLHQILIINSITGEVIHTIDTHSPKPSYRLLAVNLHVDAQYIYYTNTADRSLHIYDVTDYQLIKKLIAPEGCSVRSFEFTDTLTGKHYFDLYNRSQYIAQGALLVLDPNNLADEITFEQSPEHSINLVASVEHRDELELHVTLNCSSLDDALRFGEIYTRDYCQWHSHSAVGMSFIGREANPQFNGIVRFIYSGCEKPAEVVNEHLAIMEKRFDRWNDGEGFYAQPNTSNENELTRLIAQYQSV